jgi:hypothetical protein
VHLDEDGAAVAADALCDGLFPLVTNDETLGLKEALAKYKYQPFVEKRHEQLKSVFRVAPVWLLTRQESCSAESRRRHSCVGDTLVLEIAGHPSRQFTQLLHEAPELGCQFLSIVR